MILRIRYNEAVKLACDPDVRNDGLIQTFQRSYAGARKVGSRVKRQQVIRFLRDGLLMLLSACRGVFQVADNRKLGKYSTSRLARFCIWLTPLRFRCSVDFETSG